MFLRDHFVAEYKAHGRSLGRALQQALLYARELGKPPLLVVNDLSTVEIHTNFTGSSPRAVRITLDDIERDAPVGGDLTAWDWRLEEDDLLSRLLALNMKWAGG